ncbi:MAG: PAS domain-containing protein, partial [Syntrophobacteraceae bacterium]
MQDEDKSKEQLITELEALRQRVAESEKDSTERKRAEAALLESEVTLKSFAEQAITGINIIQDGVFKYVNPKFAQMFGYTVEECLNDMPFMNLVYGEDLATVEEQVRRRLSGEAESIYYTFRGLKKNGQIFPLETYGSTIVYKGKPAATSTTLDITERKRAEAMLASVNRQNELLLNSVGDGIYGLDLEGRTTFVNPKAVNLVGYNLEEMIGRLQHDLIHHTKSDGSPYRREECPICAAFKDAQEHHVDTDVFWRKDGTSFPVVYTRTPIRDENGELQGAVVVFSDITERKRAEAEKIQMEQRLQKLE